MMVDPAPAVVQQRLRPARGATSPSASERGWGPASSKRRETRTTNGTLHRSGLPAVPARRHEALSEGGALLHGEVRHREAQPAAGAARQAAQGEAGGLRPAVAR